MNIRELNEAIDRLLYEDFNTNAAFAIHSLLEVLKKRLLYLKEEVLELTGKDELTEGQKNRLYNVEYLANVLGDGYSEIEDEDIEVPLMNKTVELKEQFEYYLRAIENGAVNVGKQLGNRLQKLKHELSGFGFDAYDAQYHTAVVNIFVNHVDKIVELIDKINKDYFEKAGKVNPNVDMSIVE